MYEKDKPTRFHLFIDKNSSAFTNKNTHTLLNIVNIKLLYNKLDSDSRRVSASKNIFPLFSYSFILRLIDVQSSTVIFITIKNYDNI